MQYDTGLHKVPSMYLLPVYLDSILQLESGRFDLATLQQDRTLCTVYNTVRYELFYHIKLIPLLQ